MSQFEALQTDLAIMNAAEWPEIIPLDDMDRLPEFPVEIFPPNVRDYILAVAESYHVPADMPAMLALSICGLAIQGKIMIKPQDDWRETASIYTMVLMESGQKKSPIFRELLRPVKAFEKQFQSTQAPAIAEAVTKKELLEKERKQAITEGDEQRAFTIDRELLELPKLHEPLLLADNITSEQLAILMSRNNGRMGIFAPEADAIENIAGKYSNGRSDCKLYLRAHSGDGFRYDRVNRDPVFVDNPALSIGLCVQPTIIQNLQHKQEFREVGLLPRFLFSVPRPLQTREPFYKPQIPEALRTCYDHTITHLLGLWQEQTEAVNITLTPEAERCFAEYFVAFNNPQDGLTEWRSKLRGQVLRIAAAISFLRGQFQVIDETAICGAIQMAAYLEPHTKAAYGLLEADTQTRAAIKAVRWMRKRTEFTANELLNVARNWTGDGIRKRIDLDPILEILIDLEYIRPQDQEQKRGRPSEIFDINPRINIHNIYKNPL